MSTDPDDYLIAHYVPGELFDVHTSVDGEVAFACDPGVAFGRASVSEAPDGTRWLGLSALRVAADRRRQGHGRAVCSALAAWGAERGATRSYAQVNSGSADAFGFFEAVGLAGQHRTRYLDARLLAP